MVVSGGGDDAADDVSKHTNNCGLDEKMLHDDD